METKKETFIYEGLGFPIELIDTPMKKVFGKWVIDIDMDELQLHVFKNLIHRPRPLTGKEIRFMRKFLEMSTTEFGKKLGVSHATVVKWEKAQTRVSPMQESYIRLFLLECLQENEMMGLYKEITPEKLMEAKRTRPFPLPVQAKQLHRSI